MHSFGVFSGGDRVTLTRRIPVREERQAGWRTQIVDHETESWVNEATRPCDKIRNDTLGILVFVLTFLFAMGELPRMWKRDISSAFRRVPILSAHLDLAHVVWMYAGTLYSAGHLGMPFGTVSAVYAWYRVGFALWYTVVAGLLAPMGRYVEDYFGASKTGVVRTGGAALLLLPRCLGSQLMKQNRQMLWCSW